VLGTESLDEFDVLGFRAGFDEHAKVGLPLVESLGTLTKTASKTIMDERVLQNLLKGILDGKLALGGICSDFDLLGRRRRRGFDNICKLEEKKPRCPTLEMTLKSRILLSKRSLLRLQRVK